MIHQSAAFLVHYSFCEVLFTKETDNLPKSFPSQKTFKVRYIGEDAAEIRNGEIYPAHTLRDCSTMYGIKDRSGECYAYLKSLFEIVE